MSEVGEILVDSIPNIKVPGFSSITYWSIVFSNKAIYFCKMDKNSLYGVYGAIKDVYLTIKNKNPMLLDDVLKKSKEYHMIDRGSFNEINYKKTLSGGIVSILLNNGKKLKFKLSRKQYGQFISNIG